MIFIRYLPLLNAITGNPLATIFLLQVIYWFMKMKNRPFYKFIQPNKHVFYKNGDSWKEELRFSLSQFKISRRKVSSMLKEGKTYKLADLKLVLFWKVYPNLTYYALNYVAVIQEGKEFFPKDIIADVEEWESKLAKQGIALSEVTFSPSQKEVLPLSYIQEITTEDKTKNNTEENQRNEFNDSYFF